MEPIEEHQPINSRNSAISADDISVPRGYPFPIVGIGASAGGLEAVIQFLEALPGDTGMAFVFIQHLDPNYDSHLAELLGPATPMPVIVVEDGMPVQPNHVYVIPPNQSMTLSNRQLRLAPREPGRHLPVDTFFCSLAGEQGGGAIGIVLSGNATDGSLGIRAIKAECGLAFAQDASSARYSGMPQSAISTGVVDYVLSPQEIARELINISKHPYIVPVKADQEPKEILPEGDGELRRIFNLLQGRTTVDFRNYKRNTVRRRIGRRMVVRHTRSLAEYASYLADHPAEVAELYRDLLISVTNFFRDPPAFSAVANLLKARIVKRSSDRPVRIWVPGCATGEEVYSLAITVYEILQELQMPPRLQVFGTDISDQSLERARTGVYSSAIENEVSAERLRSFFIRSNGGYKVAQIVRDCCVFSRQDLAKDPPFGHTDLVSCRNVLIYMNAALQRQVLPVFHYSLNPDGLLLLGNAETIAAADDLFEVADQQNHIYGRRQVPVRLTLNLSHLGHHGSDSEEHPVLRPSLTAVDLQKRADRIIQDKYAPAGIVVDSEFRILQFRGRAASYLDPLPGEANLHLLRMAHVSLAAPLRRLVEAAIREKAAQREAGVRIEARGEYRQVNLEVIPIAGAVGEERYYLTVFEEAEARPPVHSEAIAPPHISNNVDAMQTEVREMAHELAEMRDYVRKLTEDHEAHSEELHSANEEIQSANEELHSTNEELNVTKEELQSANQELTTVNEELEHRNQEVTSINSDLNNILSAVSIPLLMVDSELRLRRFNSAAETLFGLSLIDNGRPLAHLPGPLDVNLISAAAQRIVETLHSEETEIQDSLGNWYSLVVRPYRTLDDRINGAVIVLLNINPLKRSLKSAEEARDYAEAMIETVREPLVVLDGDLRVQRATSSFYDVFQVSRRETIGRFLHDLGNGQWNQPRLRELLGEALFNDKPFQEYEIKHDFPHIGKRTFRLNARRIPRASDDVRTVLLAMEDVTARQEEAEVRYRRLFETAKDAIVLIDFESGNIDDVNPYMLELTGYPRDEFIGKQLRDCAPFKHTEPAIQFMAQVREKDVVRVDEATLATRLNGTVDAELVGNRYLVGGREVAQINIRDITNRRRAAEALRQGEERFRLLIASVHDYALFQMDVAGNITTWNPGAERLLGYSESEILGQPASRLFVPEDIWANVPVKEIETARSTGQSDDERWHVRKDGSRFFATGVVTAIYDESGNLRGFSKIMRDITERRQADEKIRASLREKEILLKEIHHRVKNNLQVITSLIRLQSDYIRDPQALGLFAEMHNRVRSIAAIHEMLYAADDLSKIDFGAYLQRLAQDLLTFYNVDPERLRLHTDIGEAFLDIRQAVPCGLIVNELLTNSLKYAFADQRPGVVQVSLQCLEDRCILAVADNGIGLPVDFDPKLTVSMGLQLVNLLIEQVQGSLQLDRTQGTRFTISLPRTLGAG